MARELAEIVAELAECVGDDADKAKAARDALLDTSAPAGARLVAQTLIERGRGGRTAELQPKLTKAENDLRTAQDALAAKDEEIAGLIAKAPNAAQIEADTKAKYDKKLKEATERGDAAELRARELNRQVARDLVQSLLTQPDAQGVYVEPEHADLVLHAKYGDRFVDVDGGGLDLLQIDEAVPYEGKDLKAKAAAMAADIRKRTQTRNLITSADSGAGVRGGGGGGSGTMRQQIEAERKKEQDTKAPTGAERLRGATTAKER